MSQRCFLNIDGVLADLVGPLARAHGSPLTRETWPPTYDLSGALGLPDEEIWSRVRGASFWENLPKLPWADDLVAMLKRWSDRGHGGLCLLSQPVRDPASFAGKAAWIQAHYPGMPFLLGNRKTIMAAPGFVLVDDYERNEQMWRDGGGRALLFPAPWNRLRGTQAEQDPVYYVDNALRFADVCEEGNI